MDQLQVCCCAAACAPSRSTSNRGWSVCWLSSHPDPLLRLYLRSRISNVVMPEEYWWKCGGVSNYNGRASKGLYYEKVGVISLSSCGNLSSLFKLVCRVAAWRHLVEMWLSTHSCPSRGRAVSGDMVLFYTAWTWQPCPLHTLKRA